MRFEEASNLASEIAAEPYCSDMEVSIAVPGHPLDGREQFCQGLEGPHMVAISKGTLRAFLWKEFSNPKFFVREWCMIGESAKVVSFATIELALQHIIQNVPAREPKDDFEDIRAEFLRKRR